MNKIVRLTESDLHRIVKESVNKTLNEMSDSDETIMISRTSLPRIRSLYNKAIRAIDELMAECEQFPNETVKNADLLPGCRLAKNELEKFFGNLV